MKTIGTAAAAAAATAPDSGNGNGNGLTTQNFADSRTKHHQHTRATPGPAAAVPAASGFAVSGAAYPYRFHTAGTSSPTGGDGGDGGGGGDVKLLTISTDDPIVTHVTAALDFNSKAIPAAAAATPPPPPLTPPSQLFPARLSPDSATATRSSDPGMIQRPPHNGHHTSQSGVPSRFVRNVSISVAGQASAVEPPPPPPPPPLPGSGATSGGSPALLRSGSFGSDEAASDTGRTISRPGHGAVSASGSIAGMAGSGGGGGDTAILASGAGERGSGAAASPSFRRQQSGGGSVAASPSFRRQQSGGGGALSVTFSTRASVTSSNGSHVLPPYGGGEDSGSQGGRLLHAAHERASAGGGSGGSGRRRGGGWLRGLGSCFGGGSSDRLVGYHGEDDLAVVAMQRRENLQHQRKGGGSSRRLSKAMSDTFMVRSSRPIAATAAAAAVANGGGGASGPGAGSSRKLQPMLSLQPQKSILKSSSSLKRRAGDGEPALVKVASARVGAATRELTAAAAVAFGDAMDADGDGRGDGSGDSYGNGDGGDLLLPGVAARATAGVEAAGGTATAAAAAGEEDALSSPRLGKTAGAPSMRALGALGAGGGGGGKSTERDASSARPTPTAAAGSGKALTVTEAAAVAASLADDPPSQVQSGLTLPVQISPSAAAVSRFATAAGSEMKGGGGGGTGWFSDGSPLGGGSETGSPANGSGSGSIGKALLRKSRSLQLTTHARLGGGSLGTTGLAAAAGGMLESGTVGRAAPPVAISASGVPPAASSCGGGDVAGNGGEVFASRPSLVQRMITRQLSRGASGGGGGGPGGTRSSSPGAAGGSGAGNSPMGRVTSRNAVLPLPSLQVGFGGASDRGAEEGESVPPPPPPPPLSSQTPRSLASFRRSAAGESASAAGSEAQTPSYPSSPSYQQESLPRRRPASRTSKLAAGVGIQQLSEEGAADCFDNPLYIKAERMTAPARQLAGLIGALTSASAELSYPSSPMGVGVSDRRRRVTVGGLQIATKTNGSDVDGGGGGGGGGGDGVSAPAPLLGNLPAGSESGRWRLRVMHAMKDRAELPYSADMTSGSPLETQAPAAAAAAAATTVMVAATAADGGGQAGRASVLPASSAPSSTSSLEGYMTSIAASLGATAGFNSHIGDADIDDGDGDGDILGYLDDGGGNSAGAAHGTDGGADKQGHWQEFDTRQARRMVATELIRMRSMGFEPGVQVEHLEVESGKTYAEVEAASGQTAPRPLLDVAEPAAAATTAAAAAAAASPEGLTSPQPEGDSGGAVATATTGGALDAPEDSQIPSSRFRLTKFYSLGRTVHRPSDSSEGPLVLPLRQQRPALAAAAVASAQLTAAALRASAEAALDHARHVSCNGGGTPSIITPAPAATASAAAAVAAAAGTGFNDAAPTLTAAAPRDSLESWVRIHSRRCAADRGTALGPLDPLDELSEVTKFGAPPPPPPLSQPAAAETAGEPGPLSMPYLRGAVPQSLQRGGARLSPEPAAVQMWLHRNDRFLVPEQEETSEAPQLPLRQHGGLRYGTSGGSGTTGLPVMRQSLPGNMRLGARQ